MHGKTLFLPSLSLHYAVCKGNHFTTAMVTPPYTVLCSTHFSDHHPLPLAIFFPLDFHPFIHFIDWLPPPVPDRMST